MRWIDTRAHAANLIAEISQYPRPIRTGDGRVRRVRQLGTRVLTFVGADLVRLSCFAFWRERQPLDDVFGQFFDKTRFGSAVSGLEGFPPQPVHAFDLRFAGFCYMVSLVAFEIANAGYVFICGSYTVAHR